MMCVADRCFDDRSHVLALKWKDSPRQIAGRSGERQSGQGGGGPSFVKQVEAPPNVSQAPGLLQVREKMEGQGLDFPQEPLPCSGTAREGSGQGQADAGHVSTRGSSSRGGPGGGVTESSLLRPSVLLPGLGLETQGWFSVLMTSHP